MYNIVHFMYKKLIKIFNPRCGVETFRQVFDFKSLTLCLMSEIAMKCVCVGVCVCVVCVGVGVCVCVCLVVGYTEISTMRRLRPDLCYGATGKTYMVETVIPINFQEKYEGRSNYFWIRNVGSEMPWFSAMEPVVGYLTHLPPAVLSTA